MLTHVVEVILQSFAYMTRSLSTLYEILIWKATRLTFLDGTRARRWVPCCLSLFCSRLRNWTPSSYVIWCKLQSGQTHEASAVPTIIHKGKYRQMSRKASLWECVQNEVIAVVKFVLLGLFLHRLHTKLPLVNMWTDSNEDKFEPTQTCVWPRECLEELENISVTASSAALLYIK